METVKSFFNTVFFVIFLVAYSLIAGFIFILGIDLVCWVLHHLMRISLLTFFETHKGWEPFISLFLNYRAMAVIFGTGLVFYVYNRLSEEK